MTQEIKQKLEQAANKCYGNTPGDRSKNIYKHGAQTILENPGGWGLVEKRLVDAGIQLRIETVKACEETHLQNEKYRDLLEKLKELHSDHELTCVLIEEALKQQ